MCRTMGINNATAIGPWNYPDFPHEIEASHPDLVPFVYHQQPAIPSPLSEITLLRLKSTIAASDIALISATGPCPRQAGFG